MVNDFVPIIDKNSNMLTSYITLKGAMKYINNYQINLEHFIKTER